MKKNVQHLCLLVLVCTGWNAVEAQRTEYLRLQPHRVQIASAFFSKVEVMDSRNDTAGIGFMLTGVFNRIERLGLVNPLKEEIAAVVGKMIDGAKKQGGTLLINLRHFSVYEEEGFTTVKGTFVFDAGFYLKQDSGYQYLFTIDSAVTIKNAGFNLNTKLLDTVPEVLGAFIAQAAGFDITKADPKQYTAYDIRHLDDQEKKAIPVYNVEVLHKGLYDTYDDFKNNRPYIENVIFEPRSTGGVRPSVYEIKTNGKRGRDFTRHNYFAISDGSKAYILGKYLLHPLIKKDNDFYFDGVVNDPREVDQASIAQALVTKGFMGGVFNTFEYKIDYSTGKFIPVKKIKN